MKRKIVNIDEEKCNGCGLCVPNCHEGALQIIDGKARLISDLMCDGLGACLGHCPEGAIAIEEREAEPYDEVKVIKDMIPKGKNTVIAHLKHLKEHEEFGFLREAVGYMQQNKESLPFDIAEVTSQVHIHAPSSSGCGGGHGHEHGHGGGCPGSRTIDLRSPKTEEPATSAGPVGDQPSELRQWPVQMHLVNPVAPYFRGADLVMAADCVAFAMGNFHSQYLKGKSLAIACPKLDNNKEVYVEKLVAMIDEAKVNTITVMIMEVPCCSGLLQMVNLARKQAQRNVPVKAMVIGLQGQVIKEDWI